MKMRLTFLLAMSGIATCYSQEITLVYSNQQDEQVVISSNPNYAQSPVVNVSSLDLRNIPVQNSANNTVTLPPGDLIANTGASSFNDNTMQNLNVESISECIKGKIEEELKAKLISKGCEIGVRVSYKALQRILAAECVAPDPLKYMCGISIAMQSPWVEKPVKYGAEQGCVWAVKKIEERGPEWYKDGVDLYMNFKSRLINNVDELLLWSNYLNTVEGAQWLMGKMTSPPN